MKKQIGIKSCLLFIALFLIISYLGYGKNMKVHLNETVVIIFIFVLVFYNFIIINRNKIKIYGLIPFLRKIIYKKKTCLGLSDIKKVNIERRISVRSGIVIISFLGRNNSEEMLVATQILKSEIKKLIKALNEIGVETEFIEKYG